MSYTSSGDGAGDREEREGKARRWGGREREREDKVQQREQKGKFKRRQFEAEHMGWMMLGKKKRAKQVAVRLW
jgi:fatty-acid desaturase